MIKAKHICLQAGLDSLGAVELRNAIMAAFKLDLPATVAFDYPTASSLAGFVASALGGSAKSAAGADGSPHPVQATSCHWRTQVPAGQIVAAAQPAVTSGAVQLKVAGVVAEVLGKEPPVQQPLMEVGVAMLQPNALQS